MTKDNKIIRGAGGGGCFTADTKVSTPFGYKKINEIKKGDFVLSFDDKGEIYKAKVLEVTYQGSLKKVIVDVNSKHLIINTSFYINLRVGEIVNLKIQKKFFTKN